MPRWIKFLLIVFVIFFVGYQSASAAHITNHLFAVAEHIASGFGTFLGNLNL
jgi:hypothetical protein